MRVFLDTNVVLTGALYPRGPAGTMARLNNRAEFLYSNYVLFECRHLIQRDAPPNLAPIALNQVETFLDKLDSKSVPDCDPPEGISTKDEKDDPILGAALAAKADVVCTYDLGDFQGSTLQPNTPLAVHRAVGNPIVENYIQPVLLSSCGTLLYFGRIHHKSSMGPVISSSNGTTVSCDSNGYILLDGIEVDRCTTLKALSSDTEFRLTIRYNKSDFEAALWEKTGGDWVKEVISRGAARFADDTKVVLCFVPDHCFSGTIQCISGVPYFSKDKQIRKALDNYSLETSFGSLNLKEFFHRLQEAQGSG